MWVYQMFAWLSFENEDQAVHGKWINIMWLSFYFNFMQEKFDHVFQIISENN